MTVSFLGCEACTVEVMTNLDRIRLFSSSLASQKEVQSVFHCRHRLARAGLDRSSTSCLRELIVGCCSDLQVQVGSYSPSHSLRTVKLQPTGLYLTQNTLEKTLLTPCHVFNVQLVTTLRQNPSQAVCLLSEYNYPIRHKTFFICIQWWRATDKRRRVACTKWNSASPVTCRRRQNCIKMYIIRLVLMRQGCLLFCGYFVLFCVTLDQ